MAARQAVAVPDMKKFRSATHPMGVREWEVGRSECLFVMKGILVQTLPDAKAG